MKATREHARRGFWIASLLVPGWAQLMAGRRTAFAWLLIGACAWERVIGACISLGPVSLLITLPVACVVHLAAARAAYRLSR